MSDTFNPLHYLDKRLLGEIPDECVAFNWKEHLEKRKTQFINFGFIVSRNNKILYNTTSLFLVNVQGIWNFVSEIKNEKIFWLKLQDSEETKDTLNLSSGSTLVQEDISLTKSKQQTTIVSYGNNDYYYLTNHMSPQLHFNKLNFKVKDKLNSFFLTINGNQRHKNQIEYELSPHSNIKHHSFSMIQKGQLQDDSIAVIHSESSHSDIKYESLNSGKVTTQINSVIGKKSYNCTTNQQIKHIVLDKAAITNSKPNLMIENPDVVANHGNSIGTFNSNDLFYLSQRGLNKEQSYSVLSESMLTNYIEQTSIKPEIEAVIKDLI